MPIYEYYCRPCASTFEKLRPMREADQAAACPAGHPNAARTITAFATVGRAVGSAEMPAGGGGCCGGGGCACGAR